MKYATYLLLTLAIAISSCHSSQKMGTDTTYKLDEENVKPSSKVWRGNYTGTIITDECGATRITVNLLQDMNYVMVKQCPGERATKQTGKYLVDMNGGVLTLTRGNGGEVARFTIESNNTLAQIDRNGNRMQSSVTDQYVLRR